jgi:integrase
LALSGVGAGALVGCEDEWSGGGVTALDRNLAVADVDSSVAISALSKEKLRMKAQRYQRGSLVLRKRKRQPHLWEFRFYSEEHGRTVYHRRAVGSIVDFPSRKDAEKAAAQLRVTINDGAAFAPMNMEQLVEHYKLNELPDKAFSTREGYRNMLDAQVLPKWGTCRLSEIKSMKVENWLKGLKRKDGKPASPAYRAKIRNIMSAVFSHAIRNEWASTNPIKAVRTSSKRLRDPDILTPEEFRALFAGLKQRERVLVLLVGATALRRGELIGLRWNDLDLKNQLVNVTHSIFRNVEGDAKTAASRRPVPLPPMVVEELENWRKETLYRSDADYVFASVLKNGRQPLQPDMILKRHIRPVLERLHIDKKIGWHSFRHGLGTLLRQTGADIKVAQDTLRHANPRRFISSRSRKREGRRRQPRFAIW